MNYFNKLNDLNNNKYLAGITLLMLNIGSKYLIVDISKSTQQLLKLKIIRRFTIFSIFFIGTHNIVISIILTAAFIIFSNGLFNEKSKYYILPKKLKEEEDKITDDEYNEALKKIETYQQKNKKINTYKEEKKKKNLLYLQLKNDLSHINNKK
tara:strand:- start:146 stop:604 length:459 start_codon:yes stop_codon:yes gene_type:complete